MDILSVLRVLVVEDEPPYAEALKKDLLSCGVGSADIARYAADAKEMLRDGNYNLAIVDIFLETEEAGFELLGAPEARSVHKVVLTKYADHYEKALLEGAQFLSKSDLAQDSGMLLRALVPAAVGHARSRNCVFQSDLMLKCVQRVSIAARRGSRVMLIGDTGVGKEVLARLYHEMSARSNGPFEAVNCAAFSDEQILGELFGVGKDGFTGVAPRTGAFERAHGGVLFLDEVHKLSPDRQAALNRALEDPAGSIRRQGTDIPVRVGRNRSEPVDTLVIAASEIDLRNAVEEGKFEGSSFNRLASRPIVVPSLNERREDVWPLTRFFLEKQGVSLKRVPLEVFRCLEQLDWKRKNVRVLKNVVEGMLEEAEMRSGTDDAQLTVEDVEKAYQDYKPRQEVDTKSVLSQAIDGQATLRDVECAAIRAAIDKHGDVRKAAEVLGVARATLYEKMKRCGIKTPRNGR